MSGSFLKRSVEGDISLSRNFNRMIGNKIPPHSTDAEINILGAMLLEPQAISKVTEVLNEDGFYHEAHKIIFKNIIGLNERGITPDIITLTEELRGRSLLDSVGGIAYLTDINIKTPTAANVEQHVRIVQEKYLKRQLIRTTGEILAAAYDDSTDALEEIDHAEQSIFKISQQRLHKSYHSLNNLAHDAYDMINRLMESDKKGLTGVPTGYMKMDYLMGGFQNSDLIILAARPSMGKTALALSLARNIAVQYKLPVAFFSIEMAAIQLVIRLISSESHIDQQRIRTGRIDESEHHRIIKALGVLADAPLYIDDSPMLSIMELRAKCRRLKSERDIQVIFIDYLQLITSPKAESREREISIISSSLKQIAKELNVPIIALAQLNRSVEARNDKRPMLSDLRESGSIEQDADVVLFVNRPERYGQEFYDKEKTKPTAGTAEVIIGKQRNGPVGDIILAFQKNYARFENLAEGYDDSDMPDMSYTHPDLDAPDDAPF